MSTLDDQAARSASTFPPESRSALLTVQEVAELLRCSPRHIRRLADGGQMPLPIHLGHLVRWRKFELDQWIEDGCPRCRKADRL